MAVRCGWLCGPSLEQGSRKAQESGQNCQNSSDNRGKRDEDGEVVH
jgi:hypothetical protein